MELTAKDLMRTNFVTVNSSAPVSEMLGALAKAKQSHAIVFDDFGAYLGVSSKLAVLRKRADFSRLKVENTVEKKPLLSEDATLQEIAEKMMNSDSKVLPVEHKGKVVGVVFAIDVVKQIKSIKELRALKAKEIASMNPVVLPFDSTFGQLVSTMQDTHVSKIPIIGKNCELKGIVSFSDLMESMLLGTAAKKSSGFGGSQKAHDVGKKEKSLLDLPISSLIVENAKTAAPNDSVSKIIDTMLASNISDILLVEKGKLRGIVTLADFLECFIRLKKERKNIQFVNLPELDEIDAQFLNNAIVECYDKLKKVLGQITYFVVHFKFHESEGLRKKTTVHLRLSAPGKLFVASSTGWVLLDTANDAIKTLEREVFENKRR